jgi:DNA (cytosine-5)-methyltransferase 1
MTLTVGSLFSGIGGLDLGLERAGMKVSWQVEVDEYATRILERHWPNVPRWRDIRTFPPSPISRWKTDLVCGGFPCQPASIAGLQRGLSDSRWLWPAMDEVITVLRPRLILLENVVGLFARGMGDVLRDLAKGGYDAEWDCIPAAAFGAPHPRTRIFILAYPHDVGGIRDSIFAGTISEGIRQACQAWPRGTRLGQCRSGRVRCFPSSGGFGMDDGPTDELDRFRAIGNAVVPQVAEWIGRRILDAQEAAP